MLKLACVPEDKEAAEIVKKFVNDRLIALMEDIILDEVAWKMAINHTLAEDDGKKSFDELVDLAELLTDMDFAQNVSLMYLPDNFPIEQANQVFIGLYKLLKSKNEYVPELAMEYVLFHVIHAEISETDMINEDIADGLFDGMMEGLEDMDEDDDSEDPEELILEDITDEEYTTVERIPDPDRAKVLKGLREAHAGECKPEELDEYVENVMSFYEDLREYDETCFWDTDFMFLDDMTEEELYKSNLNKELGILPPKEEPNIVSFPIKGKDGRELSIQAQIKIAPWNMEEED